MRIIYLHQYFNTIEMPGSTRSYELSKRLVADGNEVKMITSKRDIYQSEKINWTNENGIDVFWIPISYSNKMSFFRRIISFLFFSYRSLKVILKIDADVIYASSTPLTIAVPAILYSKLKSKPMIFEVRDLWPEIPIAFGALKSPFAKFIAQSLEKLAYNNSEHIVALSKGMKEAIVKKGLPSNKIDVITNLANISVFSKTKKSSKVNDLLSNYKILPNDKLVIYTGALGHVNDVKFLINIAGEMKKINNSVKFIIAGEGIEYENLILLSKKINVLNDSVFFIAPIKKINIPILYSKATIVTSLFINLKELQNNSANKFFDGLSAGKPVMINYSGWQRSILENNKAGFYLPYDDYKKSALILNKIILDKDLLKAMGVSAKNIAKKYFEIDVQYPKLKKIIYSSVINYKKHSF